MIISLTSLLLGLSLSIFYDYLETLQLKTGNTFLCSLLFSFGFSITILYLFVMYKLTELGVLS